MAKTSTKTDNFATYDSSFWSFSYGTPSVVSGQGHTATTSGGSGFFSGTNIWDLTESTISLKLIQVPVGTSQYAILQTQLDGNNLVEFNIFEGVLFAHKRVASNNTNYVIDDYDSTKHAYLRMRETSSTLHFEYSANGTDWTIGASTASPSFLNTVYLHIGSGGATGSDFIFDDLSILPTTYNKYGYDGGVPGLFGVYKGYGSSAVTAVGSHETLVGRNAEIATDYLPHDAWTRFNTSTMRTDQLDPWRTWRDTRPGSKFIYGIPLLTDSNSGDFSGVVAGTYDTYFDIAANALVAAGHSDAIIRLGWEPNNVNIGPWQATSNPSGYISAYQHVVTRFRAVGGQAFKFELTSSMGLPDSIASFDTYYPGNTYVDYIGMNIYDLWYLMPDYSPAERWMRQRTCRGGIDDHVAYVASKSKQNICSEWGLYAANGSPDYDGGGDNPYFIDRMYEYFSWGNVYYQTYFDLDWGGGVLHDYTTGEAAYIARSKDRRAAETQSASTGITSSDTCTGTSSQLIVSTFSSSQTASAVEVLSIGLTLADIGTISETRSLGASLNDFEAGSIADSQSINSDSNVPTGLMAVDISDTEIDLTWDAFTGAIAYDLERDGVVVATDIIGTAYNDTGLTANTTYTYRVRAVLY